jgi:hypothetical protein
LKKAEELFGGEMAIDWTKWATPDDEGPSAFVNDVNPRHRRVYRMDPRLIEVDRNIVAMISQGDYRHRQIFELIQNAADAIVEDDSLENGGRVKIVLTQDGLYCANEGSPFSHEGIESLRYPIATTKVGNQVGRYGHGFRSVLAVTSEPQIFSKTGSFEFKFQNVVDYLSEPIDDVGVNIVPSLLGTIDDQKVSVFVVPKPINPKSAAEGDPILSDLMEWATTVIFLPFGNGRYYTDLPPFEHLRNELENFSAEFLIFTHHVARLDFEIRDVQQILSYGFTCSNNALQDLQIEPVEQAKKFGKNQLIRRICTIAKVGDPNDVEWVVFTDSEVDISSVGDLGVQQNRRKDADGNYYPVPVTWAVKASLPSSGRGEFWFHFPTKDWTSLAGIINAPWDTTTERTKVLENQYNMFLVERVSHLVHQAIPHLLEFTFGDYGKIFDVVPARAAEAEGIAKVLATTVPDLANSYATVPNLDGILTRPTELRQFPPKVAERANDVADKWVQAWSEAPSAPRDFPHWTCLSSVNRKARLSNWVTPEASLRPKND